MFVGLRRSGNFLLKSELIKIVRSHALQALPPTPGASPHAGTSSEVPQPGTSSSSFSRPSGGQDKGWGVSQGAPGVVSREASSPPARPQSSEGGGGGSVSGRSFVARKRASVSSAPSGAGEREIARSQRTSPARAARRKTQSIKN